MVDAVEEFDALPRMLNEQAWLRLNHKNDAQFLGERKTLLERILEAVDCRGTVKRALRAAGLQRNGFATQSVCHADGVEGMGVMRFWTRAGSFLNPGGVIRVAVSKEACEGVDVRDLHAMRGDLLLHAGDAASAKACRAGTRAARRP